MGGALDGWEGARARVARLLVHPALPHPQDLGLVGTLLTDIPSRNAALLHPVGPISHDPLVTLARDLRCPGG